MSTKYYSSAFHSNLHLMFNDLCKEHFSRKVISSYMMTEMYFWPNKILFQQFPKCYTNRIIWTSNAYSIMYFVFQSFKRIKLLTKYKIKLDIFSKISNVVKDLNMLLILKDTVFIQISQKIVFNYGYGDCYYYIK